MLICNDGMANSVIPGATTLLGAVRFGLTLQSGLVNSRSLGLEFLF